MNGKLGAAAPAADTYTTVYTVPATKVATLNLMAVNRGGDAATIRVALTTEAAAPLDADFIEYGAVLGGGSGAVLERAGIVAGDGEKLMVWADSADVTFRASGFEGDA